MFVVHFTFFLWYCDLLEVVASSFLFQSGCLLPVYPTVLNWLLYEAKVKSSRPGLQPMWNSGQQPLGRDLDKGWCHRHTSVKLSWLHGREWQHTRMLSSMSMSFGLRPIKVYTNVAVTSVPVQDDRLPGLLHRLYARLRNFHFAYVFSITLKKLL